MSYYFYKVALSRLEAASLLLSFVGVIILIMGSLGGEVKKSGS